MKLSFFCLIPDSLLTLRPVELAETDHHQHKELNASNKPNQEGSTPQKVTSQ